MQYTTSLTSLAFFSFHGLYPEEKLLGANFLVDVVIVCDIDQPITSIEQAINYESIFNTVKAQMALPQALIETVAQYIMVDLKVSFSHATNITVTIHKPNPAGVFKSGVASVKISG